MIFHTLFYFVYILLLNIIIIFIIFGCISGIINTLIWVGGGEDRGRELGATEGEG